MLFISLANILSSVGKMNSSRVDRGWARLATCVSSLIQHFGWQFGNLVNTKLRIEMMKKQLLFLYWICSKRHSSTGYICIGFSSKKKWQHKEEIHALLVLTSSAEKHPSLKRVKRGRRRKKMMITYESWHTVEWFVLIIQLFVDVLVVIAQFASQFMDQLFENNRVYVLPQHVE